MDYLPFTVTVLQFMMMMSQTVEEQVSHLFFFKIDLDIHRHLFFYIHFRISFSSYLKYPAGILMGMALN